MKFVVAAIALLLGAAAPAQAAETFGRSVLDRPLTLTRAGDPEAPVRVLVVGSIHGNETAGHAVVDENFRVRGMDNLYLCDASVFPTSVHVNPQLTVMGMAQYAARKIIG